MASVDGKSGEHSTELRVVIAVDPDGGARDAMTLGSVLARQLGIAPLLVHVFPLTFNFPGPAHVDVEWRDYLREGARIWLAECADFMARELGWPEVEVLAHGCATTAQGLIEVAETRPTWAIVVGSARGAASGRFAIGSTVDKLLHSSPAAVATAPQGYWNDGIEAVDRVVVAFQDTPESRAAVATATRAAQRGQVALRLLTVLLRHRMYGSALRTEAESIVMAQLREDYERSQREVLDSLPTDIEADALMLSGDSVSSALRRTSWTGAEIMVVGSAEGGQLRRVFLGDMTHRLVQAAPVPTVVLTRRTLATEAEGMGAD